jgi:hypothetical protein
VYVIGGDGSHRACGKLHAAATARKLKMSFIGIPKTIDNDIGIIDRYALSALPPPLCAVYLSDGWLMSCM